MKFEYLKKNIYGHFPQYIIGILLQKQQLADIWIGTDMMNMWYIQEVQKGRMRVLKMDNDVQIIATMNVVVAFLILVNLNAKQASGHLFY